MDFGIGRWFVWKRGAGGGRCRGVHDRGRDFGFDLAELGIVGGRGLGNFRLEEEVELRFPVRRFFERVAGGGFG